MKNLNKIKGDASFREFFRKKNKDLSSIIVFSNKEKFKNLLVYDAINKILNKNGVVVSKLFMGEEFQEIKVKAKKYFKKINFFKPNSSRNESRETYIHCSRLST